MTLPESRHQRKYNDFVEGVEVISDNPASSPQPVKPLFWGVNNAASWSTSLDDASAISAANCSASNDTTNFRSGTNLQGVKITLDGSGAAQAYFSWTPSSLTSNGLNTTNKQCILRFYLPVGSGTALGSYVDSIIVKIRDTNYAGKYYSIYVNPGNLKNYQLGWWTIQAAYPYQEDAGFLNDSLADILIFINSNAAGIAAHATTQITFDLISFVQQPEVGLVNFHFDTIRAKQWDIANYLATRGISASFAASELCLSSDFTNSETDPDLEWPAAYGAPMTEAQFLALKGMGHEVVNYAWAAAPFDWQTRTVGQRIEQVKKNKLWLESKGYGAGARTIVTPGSGWQQADWTNILDAGYCDQAWFTYIPVNTSYPIGIPDPRVVPMTWEFSFGGAFAGRLALAQALVDKAAQYKGFVSFCGHCQNARELQFYKDMADYVATKVQAGVIRTVTPSDILNNSFAIRAPPTPPVTAYASGTAYSLTNTPALVDFTGTNSVDPSIVLRYGGTYAINARANMIYSGATCAANRNVILKLRRTNNTVTDLPSATTTIQTNIVTLVTGVFATAVLPEIIYSTINNNDAIQLWGSIDTVPSAGSIAVTEANIVAKKVY